MSALKAKEIEPYWFETSTPTFLARKVKADGINPKILNDVMASREDLISIGFDSMNLIPLMFQTGYLTIKSYDRESKLFTLCLPNREVEIRFYKNLLRLYDPRTNQQGCPFDFTQFKNDLIKGNINEFMERLKTLLKDLPGEDHCESTYRAITYLFAVLCGTQSVAEHHGYKGRSDIEVATGRFIDVFEFKYNRSVEEAIDQIYDRDYAGRFAMDSRKVYLIGTNFNDEKTKRGLEFRIESLNS